MRRSAVLCASAERCIGIAIPLVIGNHAPEPQGEGVIRFLTRYWHNLG